MPRPDRKQAITGYVAGVAAISIAIIGLKLLGQHVNSTTVALVLLLVVLFVAARWTAGPAVLAAIVGMLCLNFFFLPPVGTFTITDPENWVALAAFLIVAITAGQLSGRARRRAEIAEERRREIDRLYKEIRDAFDRASHAEALRQADILKSALLDAVTHDLRTPLTSIKASVTTLLHENRPSSGDLVKLDSEDRTEMLQVIDEEADRLNRFVESLVELARIEAGEMRLRRRWITVDEIFETAVERARPFTGKHRVLVNVEPSIPLILVDAQAMAEAVYTLIDNAAKYSPEGTIIRISAEQEGEQTVRFIVADHGEGIPPQLRTRVFDKFFRLEHGRANSHPPPGTGMGLAIAKGIVEAHGGRIWIEGTATGVGTMVIVELPIGDETVDVTRTAAGSDNLPVKAGTDND